MADIHEISLAVNKARARFEAKRLAKVALQTPRNGKSVLHERAIQLTGGSRINVTLCNTALAPSVRTIIAKDHWADRIDASITHQGTMPSQTATLHFRGDKMEYQELSGMVTVGHVFESSIQPRGYTAYVKKKEVPVDARLESQARGKMADVFRAAREGLVSQKHPRLKPLWR